MDKTTYEKIKAAQENYHPKAMNIPGVHGTSIGMKQVAGELTDTYALCIHLTKKKPLDEVPSGERIPQEIEGVTTDVIESPPAELGVDSSEYRLPYHVNEDQGEYRPLKGGCQIQCGNKYGTLGCFVTDTTGTAGTVYALTCSHVVSYANNWAVFQPDNKNVCRQFGVTTDATPEGSKADVALCTLAQHDHRWSPDIIEIGTPSGAYAGEVYELVGGNVRVFKRGRTTGKTEGACWVDFNGIRADGQKVVDDILISPIPWDKPFTLPGDSGSAVVYIDPQKKIWVVGLLWGHSGLTALANPIKAVLTACPPKVLAITTQNLSSVPYGETIEGRIEAWLCQSNRGRAYWHQYRQHGVGVYHMFHIVPRLYATWLKIPSNELANALDEGITNPDAKIPATLGDMSTVEVLEKLRDAMTGHIGEDIMQTCNSILEDISANIGGSWRDAFRDGQPPR